VVTGSREENASKKSGVVEFVEIAHRLHDRLEIRPRIEGVEQLRRVGQQPVRTLDRDPDVLLRRVGQPAVPDSRIFEFRPFNRSSDRI